MASGKPCVSNTLSTLKEAKETKSTIVMDIQRSGEVKNDDSRTLRLMRKC